jgi:hypothetical protein
MTTTTRTPKETRAISRLRALGQGIRVYCLDQDKLYCVPSASGDGSVYQVQVSGETMLCSCPAGEHDKCCKHVGAVEMYREAQEQLSQAMSLAVTVGLHDALERSLEDKLADLY